MPRFEAYVQNVTVSIRAGHLGLAKCAFHCIICNHGHSIISPVHEECGATEWFDYTWGPYSL